MQLVVYILIYPFLLLISILPFRLFYLFSDFVYLLIYYVVGYRKKTVGTNLRLVFPEKSEKDIIQIQKKFYKHLCDLFLEMIKTITISKEQLSKRFVITNPKEVKRLESLGKSVICFFGHYASYEWSIAVDNETKLKGYAVYKRIANTYFNDLVKRIRSRFNTTLIHTRETVSVLTKNETKGISSLIGFLSDQSPKQYKTSYWTEFMGVNVPCFTGGERLAKKLDLVAVYLKISKIKRGYYQAEFVPLADNANTFKDFSITDKFLSELEQQIYDAPEYYLWTHKRWKHKDKYHLVKP